jgi:hypothetical protein
MSTDIKVGETVAGRYRIEKLLGQGGMGSVWEATHQVTRRAVAIKLLRPSHNARDEMRRRFLREARAATAVAHPNVVQVIAPFQAVDWRNVFILLMRFCDTPKVPSDVGSTICAGIPGLHATISPGPARPPVYFTTTNIPDPTRTETIGADLTFNNVTPGEHFVTIHAPPGRQLLCTPDQGGLGWVSDPLDPTAEASNRFRVITEEGFTMIGAEANCVIVQK